MGLKEFGFVTLAASDCDDWNSPISEALEEFGPVDLKALGSAPPVALKSAYLIASGFVILRTLGLAFLSVPGLSPAASSMSSTSFVLGTSSLGPCLGSEVGDDVVVVVEIEVARAVANVTEVRI